MNEKIKRIKPVYIILFHIRKAMLFLWLDLCNLIYQITKEQSPSLQEFKNVHAGERCFIIATGPSLTISDIEKLKNEYTISMNSIVNLFDRTSFRPTYYVIQDGAVEKRLRKTILASDISEIFIGVGNAPGFKVNLPNSTAQKFYKGFRKFNLNLAYHYFDMYYNQDKCKTEFSVDCSVEMMDGFTVTYSAIQLAVYMGFKEIYLLGCDTNHSGHVDEKNLKPNSNNPLVMNIKAYEVAKNYADKYGIKIFNATRGGMLEVFQRVALEDIL